MNTTHDYHRLSLNGFKGLERIERARRHQRNLERLGFWLTVFFLVLGLIAMLPAHAEPTNAPDTKGHFVLVVGGSYTQPMPGFHESKESPEFGFPKYEQNTAITRIQPFTITGFTSFHQCRSAGMELQARLNSDGYVLDFSCIATGR